MCVSGRGRRGGRGSGTGGTASGRPGNQGGRPGSGSRHAHRTGGVSAGRGSRGAGGSGGGRGRCRDGASGSERSRGDGGVRQGSRRSGTCGERARPGRGRGVAGGSSGTGNQGLAGPDRHRLAGSRLGAGVAGRPGRHLRVVDQVCQAAVRRAPEVPGWNHRHDRARLRSRWRDHSRFGRSVADGALARGAGHSRRRQRGAARPRILGPAPLHRRQPIGGCRHSAGNAAAHRGAADCRSAGATGRRAGGGRPDQERTGSGGSLRQRSAGRTGGGRGGGRSGPG